VAPPGAAARAAAGGGGGSGFVLVATPLSRARSREVDTYIGRYASVPALTAAITLELFQADDGGGEGEGGE